MSGSGVVVTVSVSMVGAVTSGEGEVAVMFRAGELGTAPLLTMSEDISLVEFWRVS